MHVCVCVCVFVDVVCREETATHEKQVMEKKMQQQQIYLNRLRAQVLNFENSRLSFREARQERLDAENRAVSVTNLAEELEMELATA